MRHYFYACNVQFSESTNGGLNSQLPSRLILQRSHRNCRTLNLYLENLSARVSGTMKSLLYAWNKFSGGDVGVIYLTLSWNFSACVSGIMKNSLRSYPKSSWAVQHFHETFSGYAFVYIKVTRFVNDSPGTSREFMYCLTFYEKFSRDTSGNRKRTPTIRRKLLMKNHDFKLFQ